MPISPEAIELLKTLQRLSNPEDPVTKSLFSEGLIDVHFQGIEVSTRGETLLRQKKVAVSNELEVARLNKVVDRLTLALVTIQRSGDPGSSISAARIDKHSCRWCQGRITPCPSACAQTALEEAAAIR